MIGYFRKSVLISLIIPYLSVEEPLSQGSNKYHLNDETHKRFQCSQHSERLVKRGVIVVLIIQPAVSLFNSFPGPDLLYRKQAYCLEYKSGY